MSAVEGLNRKQLESIAKAAVNLYRADIMDTEAKEIIIFEAVMDAAGIERGK